MAAKLSGSGGGKYTVEANAEINVTPFVDIMLVLLIMFIITIPIQTHAVKLDLPPPSNVPTNVDPVFNQLTIDFLGAIYWNGQEVTLPQLDTYLKQAAVVNGPDPEKQPELRLKPDALAKYDIVSRVMALAQKAGTKKMGFVGNEAYGS